MNIEDLVMKMEKCKTERELGLVIVMFAESKEREINELIKAVADRTLEKAEMGGQIAKQDEKILLLYDEIRSIREENRLLEDDLERQEAKVSGLTKVIDDMREWLEELDKYSSESYYERCLDKLNELTKEMK